MSLASADTEPSDQDSTDGASAWQKHPEKTREPWLIGTVLAVDAPTLAISAPDGQITETDLLGRRTLFGYYDQDRRVLSRAELTVDGESPEYLGHRLLGASSSKHVSLVRTPEDPTPDPVILVERIHRAGQGETITVVNRDSRRRRLSIRLVVAADLADISEVRRGLPISPVQFAHEDGSLHWSDSGDGTHVALRSAARADEISRADDMSAVLLWRPELDPGESWSTIIRLSSIAAPDSSHGVQAVKKAVVFEQPGPTGDTRLDALVSQGIDDVRSLLLASADSPDHVFAAAGAPWYLTLFGRDSLWTARLLLPVDRNFDLAYGTLSVLAALQGQKPNAETDEEPGKILHELRRRTTTHQQGQVLPPVYYGSIDSTALFVLLLVDAFRAGMRDERAKRLIDHAREALNWMRDQVGPDKREGFVRYTAAREGALFNYGWKDSYDAIVDMHGQRAEGQVALAEVQAYTYEAATGFAELLRTLNGASAETEAREWEQWAAALKERFVRRFLVPDQEIGAYFAMALDEKGCAVDGLASNMGHLLGSGMLTPAQSAQVAGHLVSKQLFSGWGLRTRSSDHPHYNPMSYHGGAVWAHDTAIAIRGLSRAARQARGPRNAKNAKTCIDAAGTLAEGLLAAAQTFDYRLPELFSGGEKKSNEIAPLRFPASCQPQAWSAAAGVAVWHALDQVRLLSPESALRRTLRLVGRTRP
jgi:glycogen debranching enzyme